MVFEVKNSVLAFWSTATFEEKSPIVSLTESRILSIVVFVDSNALDADSVILDADSAILDAVSVIAFIPSFDFSMIVFVMLGST
jgi:hypothetical protein